jgi:hypothetical protein
MNFDLSNILKTIGPAASIVFAAWIFVGFLQQRYDAAIERYRTMISQYRDSELPDTRRTNVRDAILIYKRRCELMNYANMVAISSAIFLILTLIIGALAIIFPDSGWLKYLGAGSALMGFILVIVAAGIVMVESSIIRRQIDSELLDVPDLAQSSGQETGNITDQRSR